MDLLTFKTSTLIKKFSLSLLFFCVESELLRRNKTIETIWKFPLKVFFFIYMINIYAYTLFERNQFNFLQQCFFAQKNDVSTGIKLITKRLK